ncbi:MAG: tryptophan synthase subunit alpha [Thermodesulfobacteriota bacterium]
MHTSVLTTAVQQAHQAGRQALIPFLPAGFPEPERFWELVQELDARGADIIEIGVPFSDPVADGPLIEAVSMECLACGVDLEWILAGLERIAPKLSAPIVCMGYYNPFWQYGLQRFAHRAAQAGVAGCIVPDLPLEEAHPFQKELNVQGMDLIRMIGVNTSEKRMRQYAQNGSGFVYMVAALGTTGSGSGFPPELPEALSRAQEIFEDPIALGFGLERKEQLGSLSELVDAVVFGSSLIRHIQGGGTVQAFLERWK